MKSALLTRCSALIVFASGAGLALSAGPAASGEKANAQGAASGVVMFGGTPARNMVNTTAKDVPTEWDVKSGKNIKWTAKLGSRAYAGPIVADGKVFVGTNNETPRNRRDTKGGFPIDMGNLMCFRESDGGFLWQSANDKLSSGRTNDWPREGLCSTPAIEGKRLYFVTNRGQLLCARTDGLLDGKNEGVTDEKYHDKTDADLIWRLDMIVDLNVYPHNMSSCSPLLVGDELFVITGNGVDEGHINIPSPSAPSFIAVDKNTGKVLWSSNAPGRNIMHGQWASPTYTESGGRPQVIFPGGDGWLRSYAPKTGELLWSFDCNPKDSKYDLGGKGTRSDFIATPVVYEDKIYIGVGQDPEHNEGVGHLWCIDPTKSGDVSPTLVTDASSSPPKTKPNPNSAAVWHFGGPAPRDVQAKLNKPYYFGRTMSSCAVHDGLCYACDLSGSFWCLDAKTGKDYWMEDLTAGVWGSPYWVDNKVYIGNDDGDVHIFAHGKAKNLIAKIEMGDAIRSTPNVTNGVLYVMTQTHLYAIQQKGKAQAAAGSEK